MVPSGKNYLFSPAVTWNEVPVEGRALVDRVVMYFRRQRNVKIVGGLAIFNSTTEFKAVVPNLQ